MPLDISKKTKRDKVYKNFIVKSLNKIENKEKKTRRNNMEFFTAEVGVLKTFVTAIGAGYAHGEL